MNLNNPASPCNLLARRWMSQGTGVTAGAGLVSPLDNLTSGLWGAYSVSRRLLSSYSGALLRVRRSSDNSEQNINALADGNLDTASLLSFCGAGNGFVTKVYDQLGLADMVQATAGSQPQIVASGVLSTNNLNLPAMQGSNKMMLATFASTMTLPISVYANAAASATANYELLWGISAPSRWFGKTSAFQAYAEGGRLSTVTLPTDNRLLAYVYGGEGLNQLFIDGVNRGTGPTGISIAGVTATSIAWGNRVSGGVAWNGGMTDLVIYNAAHTSGTITDISSALAL